MLAIGQQKFNAIREKVKNDNKYEYVYAFENGYAVFRTYKDKMGMIDSTGNEIIKPVFNYIHNNGSLKNIFEVGNKTSKHFKRGFIDLQGKIRIPIVYDDVYYLEQGLIRVATNNKKGVIDTTNTIILPLRFDDLSIDNAILIAEEKGTYQLYDVKGKQITDSKFTEVSYFKDNKAIVAAQDHTSFIIDGKGKTITGPVDGHTFEKILDNGQYLIRNNKTLKKGIINASGEFKISCKYDDIKQSGSVFIVQLHNKKGFVSLNDSILKPAVYDDIFYSYADDAVAIGDQNLESNYIARKGNLYGVVNPYLQTDVIPFHYKHITTFLQDYYLTDNPESKNGLFYKDGTKVIAEDYEFYNHFENKIFASKENKPCLITLENLSFTEMELRVDELVQHTDNLLNPNHPNQICKVQDKFGVLNHNGIIIIPFEYQKIENIYHSNQFIVMKNNKYGIVNSENEIMLDAEYDDFKKQKEQILFTKNNRTVKKYHPISHR